MGAPAVAAIVLPLGDTVRIADQRLIQRWWIEYAGDEEPSNTLLREFYITVVRPSDLYYYGIVFEVFDLLTNDIFEYRQQLPAARDNAVAGADTPDQEVAA